MTDIKTLVSEARKQGQDCQSPEHRAVLAELARNGNSLNEDERGDVANYLLWAVLDGAEQAHAHKAATFEDKQGRPLLAEVVDEEKFPDEIAWLKRFAQHNNPSPKIESWLARKRHAFVDECRCDPAFTTAMKRWPDMSAAERKEFLCSVIRKRVESFSDQSHSFTMPEIKINGDLLNVNPGSASDRANEITLSKAVLEDNNLPASLMTIYHEGTHNILTQLALAEGQGRIPEGDVLRPDIQKFLITRHYGLAPPGKIVSLYQADAEERIADQEGGYFVSNLSTGHGLKARFFAACFRSIEARQRDPESYDLRALIHDLRFG